MRQEVSHYRLEKLIGKGGMGEVYLGQDLDSPRLVAVKVLPETTQANETMRDLFSQEIRAASTLGHPNLVNVLDGGEWEGIYFMAMELVEGDGLDRLLKRCRRLVYPAACHILKETLVGLEYLHNGGIFHRDIKPPNIMITNDGQVKITDFGIMKELGKDDAEGGIVGTPSYMAPEQLQGGSYDNRVDLFAAGVVFFQMLTGSNPFHAGNLAATMGRVLSHHPAPVYTFDTSIPFEFQTLIDRMIAKAPEHRFARPREALDELERLMEEYGIPFDDGNFKEFMVTPERATIRANKLLSERFFFGSRGQYVREQLGDEEYIFDVFRAHLLNPRSTTIKEHLDELCEDVNVTYTMPDSQELRELGQRYVADPEDFGALVKLMEFYYAHRLYFHTLVMCRALLRVRPNNTLVKDRLEAVKAAFASPKLMQLADKWVKEQPQLLVDPRAKDDGPSEIEIQTEALLRANRKTLGQRLGALAGVFFTLRNGISLLLAFVVIGAIPAFHTEEPPRLYPTEAVPDIRRWYPQEKVYGLCVKHDLEALLELPPEARLRVSQAQDAFLSEEYRVTIARYREALELVPRGSRIWQEVCFNIAALSKHEGFFSEAMESFRNVFKGERPEPPILWIEAYRMLARTLVEMNRPFEAEKAYAEMFALAKELPPPFDEKMVDHMLEYLILLESLGKLKTSRERAVEMLQVLGQDERRAGTDERIEKREPVLRHVIGMYERIGDYGAAIRFLAQLRNQAPPESGEYFWAREEIERLRSLQGS